MCHPRSEKPHVRFRHDLEVKHYRPCMIHSQIESDEENKFFDSKGTSSLFLNEKFNIEKRLSGGLCSINKSEGESEALICGEKKAKVSLHQKHSKSYKKSYEHFRHGSPWASGEKYELQHLNNEKGSRRIYFLLPKIILTRCENIIDSVSTDDDDDEEDNEPSPPRKDGNGNHINAIQGMHYLTVPKTVPCSPIRQISQSWNNILLAEDNDSIITSLDSKCNKLDGGSMLSLWAGDDNLPIRPDPSTSEVLLYESSYVSWQIMFSRGIYCIEVRFGNHRYTSQVRVI